MAINDNPVAPRAQVSPRTLERWTVHSKAWYVDNCGRNAKALCAMMGLLPKEKVDPYAGWKSKVALFPRSEQYEYRYIRKERIRNSMMNLVEADAVKLTEPETDASASAAAAFKYTKSPIWWRDKIPNRSQFAVGLPDDYAFRKLDQPRALPENTKIPANLSYNNPGKIYVPGFIYRQKNQEDNEVQLESLDGRDAVKVAIHSEGEDPKDAGNCDCPQYSEPHQSLKGKPEDQDLKKSEVEPVAQHDPRWHVWQDVCDVPIDGVDRKNAMSNLRRPYLHEINTWYSVNKPTKQLPLAISEGKRPILEWHFSNL